MFQNPLLVINATTAALTKMFAPDRWFDWCTWKEICDLNKVTMTREEELSYRLLHCTHWKDVPQDVPASTLQACLDTLSRSRLLESEKALIRYTVRTN